MKKLLSFALVCVMLLALVPQALAAKQELVVSVSSGIESKEWFQEGMKRFNEKHPNVEVVLEPHEGISARPKIVSQIYTGNAPDVLYANLYWVKDFAKNGWITPVNDYIDEETINDFYEDFRNYATVDGKLYGTYPLSQDQTIQVVQENGHHNDITIKDGQVSMTFSDCRNQICVESGAISHTKDTIVCLPNKVVIEITGRNGDDSGVDIITGTAASGSSPSAADAEDEAEGGDVHGTE